jgi:predicted RNA-binding Zn-ribbon protein involved in translation (DUF1610 family)
MTKKKISPNLPPIEIVSDEKAEQADYLVCSSADTPSPFADNLTGFCCACGIKVIYRWHAPRKPKRICMLCAVEQLEPK